MLPIVDKPTLQYIIEEGRGYGINIDHYRPKQEKH